MANTENLTTAHQSGSHNTRNAKPPRNLPTPDMTPLGNNLLRTQLQFPRASKPKNSSLPLFAQLPAIFALKL